MLTIKYLEPSFNSFDISTLASLIEVGTPIQGIQSFIWDTLNDGNITPDTIEIKDINSNTVLGTGLANTGSTSLDIGTVDTSVPFLQSYSIEAENTNSDKFDRNMNIEGIYPWYYFLASSGVQTFDVLDCYRAESALYDNIAIVNYSNSYGCVRCHATITVVAQHSFRGCTIVDRSDTGAYMIKSDDAQDRRTNWLFQDCEFYAKPSNSAMVTFNFHTNAARDSMFFFKGTNLSNVPFGTPTAGVRLRNETNGFFYDPDFIVHWPIGDY